MENVDSACGSCDIDIHNRTACIVYLSNGNPLKSKEGYLFKYLDTDKTFHLSKNSIENFLHQESQLVEIDGEIVKIIFRDSDLTQIDIIENTENVFPQSVIITWDRDNTRLLIDEYEKKKDSFKMKKKLWVYLAQFLMSHGASFTPLQVENRFKTLERQYKKKKENDNSTGRGVKHMEFEKELNQIFEKNPAVHPEAGAFKLRNDKQIQMQVDDESANDEEVDDIPPERPQKVLKVVKRKKKVSPLTSILQDLTEEFKRTEASSLQRHNERMMIQKERNSILAEKNKILSQAFLEK